MNGLKLITLWNPLSLLAAFVGYLMAPVKKAVAEGFFSGGKATISFAILIPLIGGLAWLLGGRNAVEQQAIRVENHSINHDKQLADITRRMEEIKTDLNKRLDEVENANLKTYGEIQVMNRDRVYVIESLNRLAADIREIKGRR